MGFEQGHALLVGVGAYQNPTFSSFVTAQDAMDLADVLRDPQAAGYPEEQITLLTGPDASRQRILDEMRVLAEKTTAESTVLLFFSGNGVITPDGDYCFLTYEAQLTTSGIFSPATVIYARHFIKPLEDIKAMRLLIIFNNVPPPDIAISAFLGTGKERAAFFLSPCRPKQRIFHNRAEKNSLFAKYLLAGLEGPGAIPEREGYIDVLDLYNYVHDNVSREIKELRGPEDFISLPDGGRQLREEADQEPVLTLLQGVSSFPIALHAGGRAVLEAAPADVQLEAVPGDVPPKVHGAVEAVPTAQADRDLDLVTAGGVDNTSTIGNVMTGSGTQVNIDTVTFGSRSIDWETIDYEPHLKRMYELFAQHMMRLAGARNEGDAVARYIPLRLQETQPHAGQPLRVGTWPELVNYSQNKRILVRGAAGSGKTTLLLHSVRQLAETALVHEELPVPLYISLRTFVGGGWQALRNMMADTSGLEPSVIEALLREKHRALALFLDGVDEIPPDASEDLVQAVEALGNLDSFEQHTLVIACRPNSLWDNSRLRQSRLYELVLLSLSETEIRKLLESYGTPSLLSTLEANTSLREIVQAPDLLSALAQSNRNLVRTEVPQNAGQIYELLIDRHLFGARSKEDYYEYWYVKRPVLAQLAYEMLLRNQHTLTCDDDLYSLLARRLESVHGGYSRRRAVLPDQWSVEGLFQELIRSEAKVLEPPDVRGNLDNLTFSKSGYRDYFAAVHLSTQQVRLADIEQITSGQDYTRWMQLLVLLLGIQPKAGALLFATLYASDPSLAVQLWFENNSQQLEAPNLIRNLYERQVLLVGNSLELGAAPAVGASRAPAGTSPGDAQAAQPASIPPIVPVAGAIKPPTPSERLSAICASTQRGVTASAELLRAADDEHPLVRAMAQYALIHLGEPAPQDDFDKPMPPLIQLHGPEGALVFNTCGGCNARIGPLIMVQMPDPTNVQFRLTLRTLDFDPMEVKEEDITFEVMHTPPLLMATNLFQTKRQVDWLDLTARCWWIAKVSADLSYKADGRDSLKQLAWELRLRAARYSGLGKLLARDLGLPEQPWAAISLPPPPDWVAADVELTHKELRRLYNRVNQSLNLYISTDDSMVEGSGQLSNMSGGITGIAGALGVSIEHVTRISPEVSAAQVQVSAGDNAPGGETFKMKAIHFGLEVSDMAYSTVLGTEIDELQALARFAPPLLRVNNTIAVTNASYSDITGLLIHKLGGGVHGWAANVVINVTNFSRSRIQGVVVEDYTGPQWTDAGLQQANMLSGFANIWPRELERLFAPIYEQVEDLPGPTKKALTAAIQQVYDEVAKDGKAVPQVVESKLRALHDLAPDISNALVARLMDRTVPVAPAVRAGVKEIRDDVAAES
jgi:hypothetical protein